MAVASSSRRLVVQQSRCALRGATLAPRTVPTPSFRPTATAGTVHALRHSSSSSSSNDKDDEWTRHRAQYNYDPFTLHPEAKHYSYPMVTADELASPTCSKVNSRGPGGRPREVRMLARDFIHDSLYNPTYGYFTKQAVLLPDPPVSGEDKEAEGYKEVAGEMYTEEMGLLRPANAGFDFNAIRNESEFMRLVEERYQLFEEQISVLVQDHANTLDAARKQQDFASDVQRERTARLARRTSPAPTEYSAAGLEAAQQRGRAMRAHEGVQESDVQSMAAKQVWHTPTQIFQPHYAHAIARYLVAEYKLHHYPYDDLAIYELGAGSGALAHGILDYLRAHEPEIYVRTRYRIVEISARLAAEQRRKLRAFGERVEVVNEDVLGWSRGVVQESCFVVALEVLDNLAHDVVRFGTAGLEAYQAVVSVDETGDMHELWQPLSDPLIREYLDTVPLSPLASSPLRFLPPRLREAVAKHAPFFPNLTAPTYVPTHALRLMHTLHRCFPQHRLVMSDFDTLPDALVGTNAPVVQTRFQGAMIPVSTYLVLQGYFDIFFPTNFAHLKHVYKSVLSPGKARSAGKEFFSSHFPGAGGARGARERNVKVYSHAGFLERYAQTEKLQLRDGSNPLLSWYANASWFLS
ncbi:uncharacterized protein SRS1_11781 [Sporisorium reilianum f. sp. reilianum]|uniref:type II protein arginine methyltransferase n=1 Tax=Sporisorium reilianum f. sp. reilianum TaxID=72559 RepID=A0A2N8U5U2_9BASI|nr:uncharacterized protein SRS1_11781 [Sporisorium reilianum f. sp. reilianum]